MINSKGIKTKHQDSGIDVIFKDGRRLFLSNTLLECIVDGHTIEGTGDLKFVTKKLKNFIIEQRAH